MIIPDLTYEQYEKLPGFNSSLLKIVANESLQHAKAYMDGRRKESEALDFGHSFHELLLRGREDFIAHPATYPAPADHKEVKAFNMRAGDPLPWNGNAKICKEWIKQNATGKTLLDEEDVSNLRGMIAAIRANEDLAPYLNGRSEVAITAERRGEHFKCLTDLLPDKGPMIDFKKTQSANPRKFVAEALKWGYHIQGALNIDVLAWNGDVREEFWDVAVEEKPPHAIWIMKMRDTSPSLMRVARDKYRSALALLLSAIKSNQWPGYQPAEPEAFLPAWMISEFERT